MKRIYFLILYLGLQLIANSGLQAQLFDIPTDLLMPLATASPRLRFHLGQASNTGPIISADLPDMPFEASPYFIAQWQQSSYINAGSLKQDDQATFDERLGVAPYGFVSFDGHSHVWVYKWERSYVYELYQTGGTLERGGGSNLFLSTDHFALSATFDRPIVVDFDAKLSHATISGSKEAEENGAVMAQVFAGFGLHYIDRKPESSRFIFMQTPISSSRPIDRRAAFFCAGAKNWLFSPTLSHGEVLLPYRSDIGPLRHFHYLLNPYLNDLLASSQCGEKWPRGAASAQNWRLTGFYIGLETQTTDRRPMAAKLAPQGSVATGLQIANLTIVRD